MIPRSQSRPKGGVTILKLRTQVAVTCSSSEHCGPQTFTTAPPMTAQEKTRPATTNKQGNRRKNNGRTLTEAAGGVYCGAPCVKGALAAPAARLNSVLFFGFVLFFFFFF